jgi:hypothetical protein
VPAVESLSKNYPLREEINGLIWDCLGKLRKARRNDDGLLEKD